MSTWHYVLWLLSLILLSVITLEQGCRLAEVEAERDRLSRQASWTTKGYDQADALRDEVRRLKDYVGELECARRPPRGPYPDGMSDERLDPPPVPVRAFGFGVRGNGVWAVTCGNADCSCAAGPLVRGLPSPPTAGGVPYP